MAVEFGLTIGRILAETIGKPEASVHTSPTKLHVRVTTRASKPRVEPDGEGGCRVWVAAAPTDGEANKAVVEILSKSIGVAPTRVMLVRGQKSRDKVFELVGKQQMEIDSWLDGLAGEQG